ncbi:MAG: phosphatidate cytidylyltransferase [Candidatus Riflebacteria bacterium]|nr:phosphatidate cytidylyltransferase [Candidatus Riflebacteria bacterium]
MLARIPVILFGIPAVYGLLVAAGDEVRMVFLAIICILGQFELNQMLSREKSEKPLIEWLGTLIMLSAAHFYASQGLLLGFALSLIILMAFTVLRGLGGNNCLRFMRGLFSLAYLPFCLAFYLMLARADSGLTLFIILASVWALDMGAYAFGRSLRGPKLAPAISPNKTISGAVGGALSSAVFIIVAGNFQLLTLSQPRLIIMAIMIATIGQIADLFESVLKRESEVKDSGALLGAHGGVLDRIDSVLFLGPLCYALVTL